MPQPDSATPESFAQKYRGVFVAVVVFAALLLVLFFFPSRESGVTRQLVGFAHLTPQSTLLATLATNKIHAQDDPEKLTLEASREATAQLGNLTVCVDTPGFRRVPDQSCFDVSVRDRSDSKTNASSTSIDLIPIRTTGSYRLLLTATWYRWVPKETAANAEKKRTVAARVVDCRANANDCSGVLEKIVIPLGPVRIDIDPWGRFASRLTRFVRDLTLPIILLWLGHWLASSATKRDKRNADAALAEEQLRKDREREQDEDRQIVRILLPKVMDLSGRYYLPMTWNAERFVMISAKGTSAAGELLFHLLNFFLITRVLKEKAGGIFLKDLDAEKIFVNGNRILRKLTVEAAGGEKEFSHILDRLESWAPKERAARVADLPRWPRLADVPSPKEEVWEKLEGWVQKLPAKELTAMRYLFNALRGVLRYESNAPYFNWYHGTGSPITFRLGEDIKAPDKSVFGEDFCEFAKEFDETLESYTLRRKADEAQQKEADKAAEATKQGVAKSTTL